MIVPTRCGEPRARRRGVSPEALARAVETLAQGLPIALPTDTVYGLAVDPFLPGASDRVFELKRRPRDESLPVLVASTDQALALATAVPELGPGADGPLLARRRSPSSCPPAPAWAPTWATTTPPSASAAPTTPCPWPCAGRWAPWPPPAPTVHGQPTLTTAAEVAEVFGDALPVVLDGGTCTGSPSTVVDCTGFEPRLLREGRVPWSAVLAALDD